MAVKELGSGHCIPLVGCLYDQVQNMIDRISCAVEKAKWNPKFVTLRQTEYPKCNNLVGHGGYDDYKDYLFINVCGTRLNLLCKTKMCLKLLKLNTIKS